MSNIWCLVSLVGVFMIGTASALKCYECNVWKAGYGHLCDNPRIRDDCTVCMKTETTIFMGYYKNTPRTSTIVSKICGKTKTIHFGHECHYYQMADGMSIQCYCDDDECNSAPTRQNASLALAGVLATVTMVIRRWLS